MATKKTKTEEEKLQDKLDRILQALDMDAESENYHDYNFYGNIADIVKKHGGLALAVKVMNTIHKDYHGFI